MSGSNVAVTVSLFHGIYGYGHIVALTEGSIVRPLSELFNWIVHKEFLIMLEGLCVLPVTNGSATSKFDAYRHWQDFPYSLNSC